MRPERAERPEPSPLQQGRAVADPSHYLRAGLLQLTQLPPLSLYVHLPWCLQKCPYCDFNSHGIQGGALARGEQQHYVRALLADLEAALPLVWGRPITSIFFGGGTPSLFAPEEVADLLSHLRARLPLVWDCEITLEANPGTFETDRFKAFAQAGITRLSIGVQSFNDKPLAALGRAHSGAQARAAVQEAALHFETFNLDLMYALPHQSLHDLCADLETALSFAPPHVSIYHLTIEPNTYFAKHPPAPLPDDDLASDMLDAIVMQTAQAGLARYEVSAFAREGHRSRHNLNYWTFGDYLGIGAGAHSKLTFAHRIVRQSRLREPQTYVRWALEGRALASDEEVAWADIPFEFMLNALRLKEGVLMPLFVERTGLSGAALQSTLQIARDRGLLAAADAQDRIVATQKGFDFLTDLQSLFLPRR